MVAQIILSLCAFFRRPEFYESVLAGLREAFVQDIVRKWYAVSCLQGPSHDWENLSLTSWQTHLLCVKAKFFGTESELSAHSKDIECDLVGT